MTEKEVLSLYFFEKACFQNTEDDAFAGLDYEVIAEKCKQMAEAFIKANAEA